MMASAGIVWGYTYLVFEERLAGSIPLSYAILSYLSVVFFARTRRYKFFRTSQLLFSLLLPFLLMIALGGFINSSAVVLWSLTSPLGALLFAGRREAVGWFLAYLALVAIGSFLEPFMRPTNNLPPVAIIIFFVMNIGCTSAVAFILLQYFVRQKNATLMLLESEQEKSENLLLNILPKDIADILKNENRTIADHYHSASILFADVVNFTPISTQMMPEELVNLLNDVFSYFDSLVEEYNLEKIKTIGDCYMVAAGVPRPRADHAHVLTHLALKVQAYTNSHEFQGRKLNFRIGINSGPVVAGVIGRKKFIYDLWGDAVNTASRMESQGIDGQIQITEATYELIKNDFLCEPRGIVNVKGKGEMEVWHVVGERL
ncbi:MAG: adenylate/guanylate cyclase domain-containing protein [Pseudomonadota bacterium]